MPTRSTPRLRQQPRFDFPGPADDNASNAATRTRAAAPAHSDHASKPQAHLTTASSTGNPSRGGRQRVSSLHAKAVAVRR